MIFAALSVRAAAESKKCCATAIVPTKMSNTLLTRKHPRYKANFSGGACYMMPEDYLRAAHAAIKLGGDAVYCAASLEIIARLAAEGIPVISHVGLIPSRATWTGGFKAVGKTAESALRIFAHVQQLEAAGAIGAEIEVVPARVATEISGRTSLILLSMGAGAGCDAQYLFAEDVLGYTRTHRPRHAKVYRDFRSEFDRLQRERIAAFKEYRHDVDTGAYPEAKHLVPIADAEFEAFLLQLPVKSVRS
jgi:3-methyl-2-oxobutanoate hydroxymethyltransferase